MSIFKQLMSCLTLRSRAERGQGRDTSRPYSAQVWTLGFPGYTRCVYEDVFESADEARIHAKNRAAKALTRHDICKECGIAWRVLDIRKHDWHTRADGTYEDSGVLRDIYSEDRRS